MGLELVRNEMAHAQKPNLVFQRNGRVHLNRRGFQFSRLLAADACASAVVMLDRPSSDTVHDCWLPTPFAYFPFTSPPVRHRVPSDSERAIPQIKNLHSKTSYSRRSESFHSRRNCNCATRNVSNGRRDKVKVIGSFGDYTKAFKDVTIC